MRNSTRILAGRGLLLLAGLAALPFLSACGNGGGNADVTLPPPPLAGAARFGDKFAVSFNAAANSDPTDPAAGDIIALSLTTDPLGVP